MEATINLTLIQDSDKLKAACESLHSQEFIVIDTEFSRNKTFFPILSLIQIAAHGITFAVDALVDIDFTPLLKLLTDHKIVKVIHSSRQDIEVIYTKFNITPMNIFDTQIALQFLGFQELVGYDTLVNHYLGITINKHLQNSDWLQRPLSHAQLSYAVSDVYYLLDIYPKIYKELNENKRLTWLQAEVDLLTKGTNFYPTNEELLKRFLTFFYKELDFQICLNLIRWREQESRRKNVLRTSLLKDEELTKLVINKKVPHYIEQRLPDYEKHIKAILGSTELNNEDHALISKLLMLKKNNEVSKNETYEVLKILLRKIALTNNIAISLIANADDLVKIASGNVASSRVFKGWRNEVFGNVVNEFLNGTKGVYCFNGKVIVK